MLPETKKQIDRSNPLKNTLANRLPEVLNVVSIFKVYQVTLTEKVLETDYGDFIINFTPSYTLIDTISIDGAGCNAVNKIFNQFAHLKHKKIVIVNFEYGHYIDNQTQYYHTFPVQIPVSRYADR